MALPNFIYGGPPKAGSSWIYSLLDDHPDVFVPNGKYVQFFTDFYDRGIDWYAKQYEAATPRHTARCDLTTDYLFFPEAAERLARHIPDAKVFFSLRNPIERDWSAYQHLLRVGMASGPIEKEIEGPHGFLTKCSAYSDAIERSWRLFGKENTQILWFDDIRTSPQATADQLHEFLGVSPRQIGETAGGAVNTARAARNSRLNGVLKDAAIFARAAGLSTLISKAKNSPLINRALFSGAAVTKLRDNPETYRFLQDRHSAEIARLETMLSKDLSAWRPAS